MTQPLPPSLDQYPGYFPAAKPPFWTRGKVGVAAGIAGLVLGIAASPGSANSSTAAKQPAPSASPSVSAVDIQQQIDDAVSETKDQMSSTLATVRGNAQQRLSKLQKQAAAAQRRAVAGAVARTQARDHVALVKAVAAAKAAAQAAAPPPASTTGGGTDPRFSYCYEANAAGYGPYFEGQDPEYYWYDDADGDGEVCE